MALALSFPADEAAQQGCSQRTPGEQRFQLPVHFFALLVWIPFGRYFDYQFGHPTRIAEVIQCFHYAKTVPSCGKS
jgi:hypothetical protein